jgi:riboflavin kinase/FMN adenylyltransferase
MSQLILSLEDIPEDCRRGSVAVGNFDGVHVGHRLLAQELVTMAKEIGGPAVVLTFDPPPSWLLHPRTRSPALTTIPNRARLLFDLGVQAVVACPTTMELLRLEAETFFDQVLLSKLGARGVVEGPNFHFGRDRRGDLVLLETLCGSHGLRFKVVSGEDREGTMVSSSRIRGLLMQGDIEHARELLGRPYQLEGKVGTGAARGRTLGFPTANLDEVKVLVPAHGVYAGTARVDGMVHVAAIHIGPNPTFVESRSKIEVHLLDFDQDLYGQTIAVDLHYRLRGVQRFASREELVRQLEDDLRSTRFRMAGS